MATAIRRPPPSTSLSRVDEGPRVYIERINVRGNTRTRDYVIRREFDVGEGDAYNRALIDRAERRLKNLNYFKNVKITNEPGSAPDRIVLNVDVEEMPTGEFSIAGGYLDRRAAGWPKSASPSATCSATASTPGRRCSTASTSRGFELSFAEPFFLGYRLGVGIDLYAKQTLATNYVSYNSKHVRRRPARRVRAERRDFVPGALHRSTGRKSRCRIKFNNCQFSPAPINAGVSPTCSPGNGGCYADGEASLAVRKELAAGAGAGVDARIHAVLQHPRQQPEPDRGHSRRIQAGLRRRRRRRQFHPHDRRCAQLLRAVLRRRRRAASAGRPSSPAGAAKICACSIISRWARTWFAALRRPASARAI